MKHIVKMSKTPAVAYAPPMILKLQGTLDIIDRLLLAQRQSAWKASFPIGGGDTDTDTDTTV